MKIDLVDRRSLGYLKLSKGGMPQDIRVSPDGKTFYVAEMMRGGVYMIDGDAFTETGFIPTGHRARTASTRAATARSSTSPTAGSTTSAARRSGPGSVSVIDFATRRDRRHLADPRRRQPRHGQRERRRQDAVALRPLRQRGLRDRHHDRARCTKIPVGAEPHGLTVWPQPGRYSLGHTGNMR